MCISESKNNVNWRARKLCKFFFFPIVKLTIVPSRIYSFRIFTKASDSIGKGFWVLAAEVLRSGKISDLFSFPLSSKYVFIAILIVV